MFSLRNKPRFKFWIHPSFQTRFIRQWVIGVFCFILLGNLAIFFMINRYFDKEFSRVKFREQIRTFAAVKELKDFSVVTQELLQQPQLLDRYQSRLQRDVSHVMLKTYSVVMLIFLPVLVLVGIVLSHRMIGGAWRVENYLKKVRSGGPTEPLQIRESDHMKNLATDLEEITHDFERRMKEINKSVVDLKNTSSFLHTELQKDHPDLIKVERILREEEKKINDLAIISGG